MDTKHPESPIKRIIINNLFGDRTVDITFESPITILAADNGSGKTTILSIIHAVLSRRLFRLRKYSFDSISIESSDGRVEIPEDLVHAEDFLDKLSPRHRRYWHLISDDIFSRLADAAHITSPIDLRRHPDLYELSEKEGIPIGYLHELLTFARPVSDEELPVSKFMTIRQFLTKAFPFTCLYFPTYRRIEDELDELGYSRKENSKAEGLIRFGMNDVTHRIKSLTEQIQKSSVEWYSRTSGQMLEHFVDDVKIDDKARDSIKEQTLKIVLDRVGSNISDEYKLRVMKLVESNDIREPRYDNLSYFLSNLIKIYDQQRKSDFAIKEFTRLCNKYLIDKEVVYNESTVDVTVVVKTTNKPIDLAKLSSGEKQIVSLFSRIYLEGDEELALLFDEPELSLS